MLELLAQAEMAGEGLIGLLARSVPALIVLAYITHRFLAHISASEVRREETLAAVYKEARKSSEEMLKESSELAERIATDYHTITAQNVAASRDSMIVMTRMTTLLDQLVRDGRVQADAAVQTAQAALDRGDHKRIG